MVSTIYVKNQYFINSGVLKLLVPKYIKKEPPK